MFEDDHAVAERGPDPVGLALVEARPLVVVGREVYLRVEQLRRPDPNRGQLLVAAHLVGHAANPLTRGDRGADR